MTSVHTPRFRTRLAIIGLGLATAAATSVGATAHAAPAPAPVKYSAKVVGKTVEIDVTNGTFAVDGTNLTLKNTAGALVLSVPLSYGSKDRKFPIEAKTASTHATLIPQTDVAKSTKIDAATLSEFKHQVVYCKNGIRGAQTKQERDDQAFNRFISQMTASVSIGSLIGLAIGAGVGLFGLVIPPVGLVTIPLGATIGAIIGTIASGAPIVAYWNQYNSTINSKFTPTCY